MDKFDIIIIGAGPAGMTAALNCLRAGKTVLVLESESFGVWGTFLFFGERGTLSLLQADKRRGAHGQAV